MKTFKKVVFPVAGLGARLAPISNFIPKEMLPIMNKPVLHFSVEEAIQAGFEEFIFIIRPGKEIIQKYVTEIFPKIRSCFIDQKKPNGLGHAILCAESFISEPFAVVLPDDIILGKNCLSEILNYYQNSNMIAVQEVAPTDVSRYGILRSVAVSGDLVKAAGIVEKPKFTTEQHNYAAIGRYLLDDGIFDYLRALAKATPNELQLSDALDQMAAAGTDLTGCIFSGKRLDCGTRDGYCKSFIEIAGCF